MVRFQLSPHLHLSEDDRTASRDGRTAMGNQLLIRAYNVGCGDCIYVRIPGAEGRLPHPDRLRQEGGRRAARRRPSTHLDGELPAGSTALERSAST